MWKKKNIYAAGTFKYKRAVLKRMIASPGNACIGHESHSTVYTADMSAVYTADISVFTIQGF